MESPETAEPLKVPLGDLRRQLHRRRAVELSARVGGLLVSDTEIDPEDPVQVEVTLEAVSDGVMVAGRISASWTGPCSLCLTKVKGDVVARVNELHSDGSSDPDIYPLHAEYVDLEPMVSDALRLELPLIARCPNGGAGVCEFAPEQLTPDDLGHERPESTGDPRWAALEGLTFDDDK